MNERSFRFTPRALAIIRHHAERRCSAATIAGMMRCEVGTIENICSKHGIELVDIPDGLPPLRRRAQPNVLSLPVEIHVAQDALELLKREAARRGTKPNRLIERLAEIIATDNLFSAVLDQ